MKNLILLFCIVFFPVFLMGQSGSQTPVGGLGYAPDSNYVIYSQLYKGRNGVAVWTHKDSINWPSAPQEFTPGIIPLTTTGTTLTEQPTRLNWNSFYNRPEFGTYQAEGTSQYVGILQWLGPGTAGQPFQETFSGPGELYMNNYITSTTRFLQGIELVASGVGGNIYRRNNSRQSQIYSTVPNNSLLNQIRFVAQTGTTEGGLSRQFAISHISTTGTLVNGGALYISRNSNNYANTVLASNIYMWIDGATRSFNLNNTYNGSTRNDYATFAPQRPLYTNTAGNVLQAPLDSFTVLNPAGGSGTLRQVLSSVYSATTTGVNFYNSDGSITANRTVTGGSNNLDFTSMGNLTATGAGSATYRFNLYPSSSLPLLLEQTSAGNTAYLQLRASLGRATLRATQDIYLEAANGVFVSPLEGSSTGIVSARPTGELIRREEAFFNAYFISDTFTVAASETEINSTFLDAISPSFTVSGDSIIYTGTDTAYFDLGYYTEAEILESATGTYLLELSCYKNGSKVFPSESWHKVYFTASETEPIQSVSKSFTTQLVTGDVLNIRQNGTTAISAALHNFSFTGQKIQ